MNKDRLVIIILCIVSVAGPYLVHQRGIEKAEYIHSSMNEILNSERDVEAIQNIKALEGLREKDIDITTKFMQVRVESALQYEGIKESTLNRAREYQKRYCSDACLGVN